MRNVPWSCPDIGKEEKEAAKRIIDSGMLTQGKETEAFEKDIESYIGCKNAVAMNNGTSALMTAMLAHGINSNDEVLVPTFTFIASVNAILAIGAKPVLVDSDPKTFNTTPELMERYLTKKTKAIVPVDVAGMPVDVDAFTEFAENNDLIVIEDAAEAIGAQYKKNNIGSFSHTAIFSFHMAKLVTSVEGGCVVTSDGEIARKCSMIQNHGMQKKYEHRLFGLNFRITDIQSAIGRAQLKKINGYIKWRNKLVKIYKKEFGESVEYQKIPDYASVHPHMIFGVLTDKRKRDYIIKYLKKNGVDTRICWPPVHTQEYHKKIFNGKYPSSEQIASRIIDLPIGNMLSEEDISYVIKIFKKALKN